MCSTRPFLPCSIVSVWLTHAAAPVTYLAVGLLDVVTDSELVSFRIGRDRSIRVTAHGNLVGLHQSYLAVLIEYTERVAFGLEDDADGLLTEQT